MNTSPIIMLLTLSVIGISSSAIAQNAEVTNTNDSGPGSLRQAINDVNDLTAVDELIFDIPGTGPHTIDLLSPLPACTQAIVIDARLQDGYTDGHPVVEINGTSVTPMGVPCLQLQGEGSLVGGLIINRYPGNGIEVMADHCTVQGCWFGVNAGGVDEAPNATTSRAITVFGELNEIGGLTLRDRNVMVRGQVGIRLEGTAAVLNTIRGNWIGLLPNVATTAYGPTFVGIQLLNGPSETFIGTEGPSGSNVIVGCGLAAILLSCPSGDPAPTSVNSICGNFIGTDPTGTVAIGNTQGISILNSPDNSIGGAPTDSRNVISGLTGLGGAIELTGEDSTGNVVLNNYIGVDATGNVLLPNVGIGIALSQSANNNTLGDSDSPNIVAGGQFGVVLTSGAYENTVTGNHIGVGADGVSLLGNTTGGVVIGESTTVDNVIGGIDAGSGNIIAGSIYGVAMIPINSRNSVLGNSIRNNTGLGIERSDNVTFGVTPNDLNNADGVQNYPVITEATSSGSDVTTIGSLNSTPNTTDIRIEFFANSVPHSSGAGEGELYLGSTLVNTDGSGNATFNVTLPVAGVPSTSSISATATSAALGTSEFSYTALAPVTLSGFQID